MFRQFLTLPNALSISRIFLLVPILFFYYANNFLPALIFFLLSALTDFLDGKIARAYNKESTLGRALDPLADKITFVSLITIFGWSMIPQKGIMTLIVLELLLFFVGTYAYFKPHPHSCFTLGANPFGKIKTCAETLLIALLILSHLLTLACLPFLNIVLFICIGCAVASIIGHVHLKPLM